MNYQIPNEVREMRKKNSREIGMIRLFFYIGTAASFAAAASDFVDSAVASALGNIGILCILTRLYLLAPVIVARMRGSDQRWALAEADIAEKRYPWLNLVSRVGWILLFVAVLMQMSVGIS